MYSATLDQVYPDRNNKINTLSFGDDVYILKVLRRSAAVPDAPGQWYIELVTGDHAKIEKSRVIWLKHKLVDEVTVEHHLLG